MSLAEIRSLAHKRQAIIGEIAVLRSRHRKRRPLQKILQKLTTQQLLAEYKLERKQRRAS